MPDELENTGVGVEHSVEEDVDFLAEGEEEEKPLPEGKEEEEEVPSKEEEEEELPPEEEEEGKPPKEKEEEEVPTKIDVKALSEKYPDLFKKFPGLRHTIFREQEYAKLFPTIEDAQEAQDDAESFDYLRDVVLAGNVTDFLSTVKEADPAAIDKIASNFLPALYKESQDLYIKITAPLLVNAVRSAYMEGESAGNDNLKNSALFVSKYLFGDFRAAQGKMGAGEVGGVGKPGAEKAPPSEVDKQRQEYYEERIRTLRSEVEETTTASMKDKISQDIDPDEVLTPYVRDSIIRDTLKEIDRQLGKDERHVKYMGSLWRRALKAGLPAEWKSRLQTAYLARAESLIPAVRSKFLSDALGTTRKSSAHKEAKVRENESRGEKLPPRVPSPEGSSRKIDYSRTSDLDIIEGREKFR